MLRHSRLPKPRLVAAAAAASALVLTLVGCAEPAAVGPVQVSALETIDSPYQGTVLEQPFPRPRAVLTDTDGKPYDLYEHTRGRVTLLFFGYTNCPDVCPTTAADIAVAVRSLPEEQRDDLTVLVVTTDPARDTGPRLRGWLDAFDPSFVGLTGEFEQLQSLAAGYGIPIEPPRTEADGSIVVDHGAQVIVFGTDDESHLLWTTNVGAPVMKHDLGLMMQDVPVISTGGSSTVQPKVSDPWVRIPMPDQAMTAAYLAVQGTGKPDRLVGARSDYAGRIELHTNVMKDGKSTMTQVDGYDVPASGTLTLEPGGHHLMLFDLKRDLKPGNLVSFTLEFASGAHVTVMAEARSYLPDGDQVHGDQAGHGEMDQGDVPAHGNG